MPSCEIWPAPPSLNGLATPITWASAATSAKMLSARARTAAEVKPASEWSTICTVSPAFCGNSACRVSEAACDSEPGWR